MAKDFISDDEAASLIDDSPTATMGAKALQPLANQAVSHIADQIEQGGQQIHQAAGSVNDPATQQALLGLGQQAAMSTVGKVEVPQAVEQAASMLRDAKAGFANGQLSQADVAFAFQKLKTAEKMASRTAGRPIVAEGIEETKTGYADGGEVQNFADGGFISDEQAAAIPEFNLAQTQTTPDFIPDHEFVSDETREHNLQLQYGTGEQQLKAGAEGFAKGVMGPLATLAETKLLGVKPEDIRGREEANPFTHGIAEIAGFAGPLVATGGASGLAKLTQAGAIEAVTGKLGLEAAGNTLASKIGSGAAKAAVENMLVQGGDEVSKMILNDPHQTVQTAMTSIGLSGALGGVIGGSLGGASALWNSKAERGTGQFIQDFKARISEHMDNPDPASAMHTELSSYYNGIKGIADDVYGASGLKAQDIQKALPEVTPKMVESVEAISGNLQKTIDKMVADPHTYPPRLTKMLQSDVEAFQSKLSKENLSAADMFEATQDLKQTVQGYAKYDKRSAPFAEETGLINASKRLASDLRSQLEDHTVWGAAAKRQQAINKAFTEYLPALKDFEKKFTVEIAGERVIDPTKVDTYVNQLNKSSSKVKKEMLGNFLDASDKYKKVLDETHANLGMESPVVDSSLNVTRRSLDQKTLGEKAADYLIHKGLAKGAGATLGGAIGAAASGALGIPHALGALIGAHSVGPFLSSVLPGIAKALVTNEGKAAGMKASTELGVAAVKGDMLMTKAIKDLFKAGREILPGKFPIQGDVLPSYAMPTERKREELKRAVASLNADPSKLLNNADSNLSHFTPEANMALAETTGNAMAYLASLRPQVDPQSPLDPVRKPNAQQIAEYNNALDIAQQPLLVVQKMHKGTLNSRDITHLQTMYPALYSGLRSKITNQMVTQIDKHGKGSIPYKTRLSMSLFLGQALDSTMKPGSIQSTQIVPGYAKQQAEGGPQIQSPSSGGRKSSPELAKTANQYMTPTQARLNHAQSK